MSQGDGDFESLDQDSGSYKDRLLMSLMEVDKDSVKDISNLSL